MVRTAQPLGNLAVYLLEPGSEDGLATWNFFDDGLKEGTDFPVVRLPQPAPMFIEPGRAACRKTAARSGRSRSTREGAAADGEAEAAAFSAGSNGSTTSTGCRSGTGGSSKCTRQQVVSQPFVDAKALAKSLARIPSIDADTAQSIAGGMSFDMDPKPPRFPVRACPGPLLRDVRSDDGGSTDQPAGSRAISASSARTARRSRIVRDFDLYAVDIASQSEHRLTTGGRDDLRHGHSDWVYFEEIWNRRWPAFWWSPDSKQLAFMEFDDAGVPFHTVMDDTGSTRTRRKNPLSQVGRAEPEGAVRRGRCTWWSGAMGRSFRVFAGLVLDQRRGLVAGQLGGLLLRAEPNADVARPGQVQPGGDGARSSECSAMRPRPGSRARGRFTGWRTARSCG